MGNLFAYSKITCWNCLLCFEAYSLQGCEEDRKARRILSTHPFQYSTDGNNIDIFKGQRKKGSILTTDVTL